MNTDIARRQTMGDLLRRSAARYPDRTAIVDGDLHRTYRELDDAVNRAANALAERGMVKGDRLALLGHNSYGFVVTYFACAKLGLICVPVNYMLGAGEVGYILEHSGATAMVAEDALVPLAEAGIDAAGAHIAVRGVIGDERRERGSSCRAGRPIADAAEPVVDLADDDPVELLYTSGTESRPKGTMLTSRSLIAQHTSCFVDGEMTPDDVEVHALPLFHSAQLHCFFTPSIHLGAVNVLLPKADPAAMLAAVEAERATKLFCPPTVWIALMNHPDFDRRDLSSLRKGYYGASIMPVEVLAELGRRLPGRPAVQLLRPDRDVAGGDRAAARGPGPQGGLGRPPGAQRRDDGRRRRRPSGPGRRGRRDRAPLAAGDARLLERPRQDRRDVPRRLAAHRRPRDPRRRGLPLRRRPQEGHDQVGRRERRLARGRGGHPRASGRGRGRRVRDPAPALDRGRRRRRRPARRGDRRAGGDHRLLPRAPRGLQDPQVRRHRRPSCPRTRAARSSSATCAPSTRASPHERRHDCEHHRRHRPRRPRRPRRGAPRPRAPGLRGDRHAGPRPRRSRRPSISPSSARPWRSSPARSSRSTARTSSA